MRQFAAEGAFSVRPSDARVARNRALEPPLPGGAALARLLLWSGPMSAPGSGAAHLVERLIADHRRIEESASLIYEECVRGDCVVALMALAALHLEIERHDGAEENALFPLLGRKLPDLGERLAHVRCQHRVAAELRGQLEQTLLAGDDVAAVQGADELYALLVGNHTTEELVIYAVIDELLAHLQSEDSASRE